MEVSFSKNFLRQYTVLTSKAKQKIDDTIVLWRHNPFHSSLRNHALQGKYKGYRSLNVTGDLRVLYLQRGSEVLFDAVGTHAQLYG